MTEPQYQVLISKQLSDNDYIKNLFYALLKQARLWAIEVTIDVLLWVVGKLFKFGGFLVWPLMMYLKYKGYIHISDDTWDMLKEVFKND